MRNPEATSNTPLHLSPHPKQHRPRSKASKGVNRQHICPLGNAANTYPSREKLRAMRCRDVSHIWATPHHNHQEKLRRLLRTNRQRTGAKSISRWTRTLERLAAVVPQHTSATSNLLPEGRVAEEASLGAARGKAGWQSQRAAKNGDQNFRAATPHPPHADTQPPFGTFGKSARGNAKQFTGWSLERLRFSSPHHRCTCSNCSRARITGTSSASLIYTHVRSRVAQRRERERGGRKRLPSGGQ